MVLHLVKAKDERYPEGTLKQQFKHFVEQGLGLKQLFRINLQLI